LLLIDAVEARQEPGTLVRLEGDEVPAFLSIKISPHQLGVPDMLAAAKLKDVYPQRIVLWGVQPERLEIGLDLSPKVESQMDTILENILEQLRAWGHTLISGVQSPLQNR
jgi:hydrogenase maturation protease